ncbi:hypothetical protein EW146_g7493 [Bondarzewia mesenterica]|uniref:Uncharacterized protein n=1 Tax=Bondarzewia mesenterica TaxID=1095465 RepID=A0A4S4LKN6_9AGAM|nr:hypothetical protein EW146_g7493 [Bondarzewia mesenterica]
MDRLWEPLLVEGPSYKESLILVDYKIVKVKIQIAKAGLLISPNHALYAHNKAVTSLVLRVVVKLHFDTDRSLLKTFIIPTPPWKLSQEPKAGRASYTPPARCFNTAGIRSPPLAALFNRASVAPPPPLTSTPFSNLPNTAPAHSPATNKTAEDAADSSPSSSSSGEIGHVPIITASSRASGATTANHSGALGAAWMSTASIARKSPDRDLLLTMHRTPINSSFNALSAICEVTDANTNKVVHAVGKDSCVGPKFLRVSVGHLRSAFDSDGGGRSTRVCSNEYSEDSGDGGYGGQVQTQGSGVPEVMPWHTLDVPGAPAVHRASYMIPAHCFDTAGIHASPSTLQPCRFDATWFALIHLIFSPTVSAQWGFALAQHVPSLINDGGAHAHPACPQHYRFCMTWVRAHPPDPWPCCFGTMELRAHAAHSQPCCFETGVRNKRRQGASTHSSLDEGAMSWPRGPPGKKLQHLHHAILLCLHTHRGTCEWEMTREGLSDTLTSAMWSVTPSPVSLVALKHSESPSRRLLEQSEEARA